MMTRELMQEIVKQSAFWLVLIYTFRWEKRYAAQAGGSGEQDQGSRDAIRNGLLSGLILGWILSAVPVARWESPAVYWIGIGLMLGGLWFRRQALRTLGRAFSSYVTVQEGQQLVQTGIYRYLRHPTYTGALIWFAGVGLVFGNALSLVATVALPLLIGYRHRIRVEEALLLQTWGESYRDYMRRTYRLVPFVW